MPRRSGAQRPRAPHGSPIRRFYEHLWSLLVVCGLFGFIGYAVLSGALVSYCVLALSTIAQPISFTLVGPPYTFETSTAAGAFANMSSAELCNVTITMFRTTNGCEDLGVILSTPLLTALLAVVRVGIAFGIAVGTICAMGTMLFVAVRGEFRARYWPAYVVGGLSHLASWGIVQFLGGPALYHGTVVSFGTRGAATSLLVSFASNFGLGMFSLLYSRGFVCRRAARGEALSAPPEEPVRRLEELSQPMVDAHLIVIPRLDAKCPPPPVNKEALRDGLGVKRIIPQSESVVALQEQTCCICLEAYDLRPQNPIAVDAHARVRGAAETPCGHHFHLGCLVDLFAAAPQGPTFPQPCPFCRAPTLLETCRRLEVVNWDIDEAL